MWHTFHNEMVNITLPSIPIPQSAAWIMLTSFPPSPGKCHCNIQFFRGFILLALQYLRNLLHTFKFLQLIYDLWLITTVIKTFLQNREDNHTFLKEWHFVPQLHNTWLLVKVSKEVSLVLFQLFLHGATCWLHLLQILLGGLLCQELPIAHVRFPVWCCNSFTMCAFCVGEHRQHTTAGHWQASSTNSCS